jgi:hypothetical protein
MFLWEPLFINRIAIFNEIEIEKWKLVIWTGSSGNTPIERFIFQKRMVTFYPEKGENKQKLISVLKRNGL